MDQDGRAEGTEAIERAGQLSVPNVMKILLLVISGLRGRVQTILGEVLKHTILSGHRTALLHICGRLTRQRRGGGSYPLLVILTTALGFARGRPDPAPPFTLSVAVA